MNTSGFRGVMLLRSRRARRATVILVLAITALLASILPPALHGLGIVVALVLVTLDILLVQATGGLAFSWRRPLDERETALRDHAYRRGFRLLGLALAVDLVLFIVSQWILFAISRTEPGSFPSINDLDNVITGRGLTAILELVVMLPTLMIAWAAGDHVGTEVRFSPRPLAAWLCLPALLVGWLLLVSAAPVQTVTASTNNSLSVDLQGATCAHIASGRLVGGQFGATVGMRVEVCWNGTVAFVDGDPTVPLPHSAIAALPYASGMPAADLNPAQPDLTSCGANNVDDFATISTMTCTATTDAAGTLHYTVHAVVSILLTGVARHDVTLTLVITRNGRILQRP